VRELWREQQARSAAVAESFEASRAPRVRVCVCVCVSRSLHLWRPI
jgi:hypothetical protein